MAMGLSGGGGRRGARRGRNRRAAMSEINVTPLVDVMLVLLIIFMVAAPMMQAGVEVDLPETRAPALAGKSENVMISISSDGTVYIGEEPLMEGDLPNRLEAMQPGVDGKKMPVTLRADRVLDYGRVMAVMGELNRAGFTSISLVTVTSEAPAAIADTVEGQ